MTRIYRRALLGVYVYTSVTRSTFLDKQFSLSPAKPPLSYQLGTYQKHVYDKFQQRNLFNWAHIIKVEPASPPTTLIGKRLEVAYWKLRLHKKKFTYILSLKY